MGYTHTHTQPHFFFAIWFMGNLLRKFPQHHTYWINKNKNTWTQKPRLNNPKVALQHFLSHWPHIHEYICMYIYTQYKNNTYIFLFNHNIILVILCCFCISKWSRVLHVCVRQQTSLIPQCGSSSKSRKTKTTAWMMKFQNDVAKCVFSSVCFLLYRIECWGAVYFVLWLEYYYCDSVATW